MNHLNYPDDTGRFRCLRNPPPRPKTALQKKRERRNLVEGFKGLLVGIAFFGLIYLCLYVGGAFGSELHTKFEQCAGTADTDLFVLTPEQFIANMEADQPGALRVTQDEVKGPMRLQRYLFMRQNRDGNGNIYLSSLQDNTGTWRIAFMSISLGSQTERGGQYDFMRQVDDAREWSPGCGGGYANEWSYVQRFEDGTAAAVVLWTMNHKGRMVYISSYMVGFESAVMQFVHENSYGNTGT